MPHRWHRWGRSTPPSLSEFIWSSFWVYPNGLFFYGHNHIGLRSYAGPTRIASYHHNSKTRQVQSHSGVLGWCNFKPLHFEGHTIQSIVPVFIAALVMVAKRWKQPSSVTLVFDSLPPHGLQHARLPCPSPTLGAYSNSCPSSR